MCGVVHCFQWCVAFSTEFTYTHRTKVVSRYGIKCKYTLMTVSLLEGPGVLTNIPWHCAVDIMPCWYSSESL